MATVAAVRITNIVSVTQRTNTYKGVRSVTISADKGRLMPILEEGKLYASGTENVGKPDHPVTTSIVFEQDVVNMLALMAEASASLVIVCKKAAGAGNQTITIPNHQFSNIGVSQNLQDFGRPSINGVAHSADGDTLPISAA